MVSHDDLKKTRQASLECNVPLRGGTMETMARYETTMKLLRTVDAVHGASASAAADRLAAAMRLAASIAEENAKHPELTKESYTMDSTRR